MDDSKLIYRVNGIVAANGHAAMMAAVEAGAFIGDVRPWLAGAIRSIESYSADRVSHGFKSRGVYGSPVEVEVEAVFPAIGDHEQADPFRLEARRAYEDPAGGFRAVMVLVRRACGTDSMTIQSPPHYKTREEAERATVAIVAHAAANGGVLPNLCDPAIAAGFAAEVAGA